MKYKVYLTRSHEVARLLMDAHDVKDDIASIGYGASTNFAELPEIYRNERTYCCVVRYKDEADMPPYSLIIA